MANKSENKKVGSSRNISELTTDNINVTLHTHLEDTLDFIDD